MPLAAARISVAPLPLRAVSEGGASVCHQRFPDRLQLLARRAHPGSCRLQSLAVPSGCRQVDTESGPSADLAVDFHSSVVCSHELADDGETDAGSSGHA